jgi:hypothetical protein
MWPSLGETIKSLPLVEATKPVKRKTDDMIIEILEIVRAEANRRQIEPARMQTASGFTMGHVDAIRAALLQKEKFLGELVAHASRWELEHGELRLYFPVKSRALAEMLQARDPMVRLTTVARRVLGIPVEVHVEVEGAP